MTVREYLQIQDGTDIKCIGIYSTTPVQDEFGRETDILDVEVTPITIIKYLDREIDNVRLRIFDDVKKDIKGNDYKIPFIKACIYVK